MTVQKEMEARAEIGSSLHTALRKCCDSSESSYLWNVIHLLDETWTAFCEAVLIADAKTGAELEIVAQDVGSWRQEYRGRRESFYAAVIFQIALDDFDEWDGFASYLGGSE